MVYRTQLLLSDLFHKVVSGGVLAGTHILESRVGRVTLPSTALCQRCHQNAPQRGTVDAEIEDPSVRNPQLKGSLFNLKHVVGQKVAMQSSPTARHLS